MPSKRHSAIRLIAYGFGVLCLMHVIAEILLLTSLLTDRSAFYCVFSFEPGLNFPFGFSLAVLLYCAIVAALSGARAHAERTASFCWWGISGGAVAVAGVMTIGTRKTVDMIVSTAQHPVISVVAGVVSIAVAVLFLRSLLKLPAATLRLLALAGGVYLAGAVAFELLSEQYCGRYEFPDRIIYAAVSTIEEVLEVVGILLVILAVCKHRQASSSS